MFLTSPLPVFTAYTEGDHALCLTWAWGKVTAFHPRKTEGLYYILVQSTPLQHFALFETQRHVVEIIVTMVIAVMLFRKSVLKLFQQLYSGVFIFFILLCLHIFLLVMLLVYTSPGNEVSMSVQTHVHLLSSLNLGSVA